MRTGHRFMPLWSLLVLALLWAGPMRAEEQSAGVTPIYRPLSILRVGTADALTLRVGAFSPVGAGDSLLTNAEGRALIDFGRFQVLLFPNSRLDIEAFALGEAGITLRAALTGRAVQTTPPEVRFAAYSLEGGRLTVTQPAAQMFLQVLGDEAHYLVVAAGEADARSADEDLRVPAGSGLRAPLTGAPEVVEIDGLPTPAGLEAMRLGCPGRVDTFTNENLTMRFSATPNTTAIGYLRDGGSVDVVGINESGTRYRVQRFSGFGWVDARWLLPAEACGTLLRLPDDFREDNTQLLSVTAEELPFLVAFFGQPDENLWFYRTLDPITPPLS